MRTLSLTLLFFALNAGEAVPIAAAAADAAVAVRKVMLFSSGVAYIEHAGTVQGEAATTLRFTAAQLNDILKSLQLQDLDGGRPGTVVFPSAEPVERTLQSFQINLAGQPPLADILGQLRGAAVTLSARGENVSGTVLSVEARQVVVDDKRGPVQRWAISVLTAGGIRQAVIEDITELKLDDPQLDGELRKALAALAQARNQDKKPVEIHFTGEGKRRVRLGYVVEAPVWKVSYRLVLPAKPGEAGAIQAWALIDNQTENDWSNVDLSLVSGRPVSFVQNLSKPLYLSRPEVAIETFAGLRPRTYESADKERALAAPMMAEAKSDAPALFGAVDRKRPGKEPLNAKLMRASNEPTFNPTASVAAMASGEKLGEQFAYTVPAVNLPRQRSAMIPIVNGPLAVERVSIYNQAQLARHPMAGALVTNTTKNHLVAGAMTVLDGGYAGDAQLGSLAPGQKRLISFAVDLPVRVTVEDKGGQRVAVSAKLVKGVLVRTVRQLETRIYQISSDADADRTLLIEHPRRGGWDLVDTPAPAERTDEVLRFRLAVASGKAAEQVVKEQHLIESRIELHSLDRDSLAAYATDGEIPAAVREALAKAVQLRGAVADALCATETLQAELEAAGTDQNRVRENLRTVGKDGETGSRLLKKLNDIETKIEAAQGRLDQARNELKTRQKALADYLTTLDVP